MKAKKLMGMIACAGACVSLSAFGNTTNNWFRGYAANDALASDSSYRVAATWPGTLPAGVTVSGSNIVLDNDASTALTVAPASSTADSNLNDGLVALTATAVLTPSDASSLESPSGAAAGFAVGVDNDITNYYGYVSGGANPGWVKMSTGPANAEAETTFTILLNYRDGEVQFKVGDTILAAAVGSATMFGIDKTNYTNLNSVAAYGSGSLTSIEAKYEVAVCAVGTDKYGSLAEAIDNGGTTANIYDVTESGASASATAASGLPIAVCKALNIDVADSVASIPVAPAGSDADEANIVLAYNGTVADGVAVTFQVKKGEALVGDAQPANAIKIPFTSGTGVYKIEPVGVSAAQ
ncbi:MAG: hypothetical protein IKU71_06610 [Kiritimatiellae bacterium]|nr:hypothetical protein [Kiritimatiellia bacterium]